MVEPEIRAYYEANGERDRLSSGRRQIEFLRLRELLGRFLPPPPADVLDVGGGAGVYAVPLAADGYRVRLIDPMELLVGQAAEAARAAGVALAAEVGDARALPADGHSADAVLLFGPLYHLTRRGDRLTALAEARRVTRPGGLVFALGLSRFYPLFEGLAAGEDQDEAETGRFLADGQWRNPGGDVAGFTTSYFHRPDDLTAEVAEAGLHLEYLAGVSGISKLVLPDLGERLDDPARRPPVTRLLRAVESEPSLLGLSQNLLAVARVPG